MSEFIIQAQLQSFIDGTNTEIKQWKLSVLLDDISLFSPTEDLLVDITLNVTTETKPIHIVQRRPYSAIISGNPYILPLTGSLTLLETGLPALLQSYSVFIYYVQADP